MSQEIPKAPSILEIKKGPDRKEKKFAHWRVIECPGCDNTHVHGADLDDLEASLGERSPHGATHEHDFSNYELTRRNEEEVVYYTDEDIEVWLENFNLIVGSIGTNPDAFKIAEAMNPIDFFTRAYIHPPSFNLENPGGFNMSVEFDQVKELDKDEVVDTCQNLSDYFWEEFDGLSDIEYTLVGSFNYDEDLPDHNEPPGLDFTFHTASAQLMETKERE